MMLFPPGLTVPPMMMMGPGAVWPAMVTSEGTFRREAVSQPLPFESHPATAVRPRLITPLTSKTIVRGPVWLRQERRVPARTSL
jgi:hypothetical protein